MTRNELSARLGSACRPVVLLWWSHQEDTTVNRHRHSHADPVTVPPWADEADIGSGEKTPSDHENDELIRQIPPLPPSSTQPDTPPRPRFP